MSDDPVSNSDEAAAVIGSLMREVPDFPEPGIQFKDLTPVLADARGLAVVTDALAGLAADADLIAGIDARGFLLGAAVATRLGMGVLAVRKGGKLPPPVHHETYALEYGTATLEIPADGIELAGRRVLVVDDVLATGGDAGRGREAARDGRCDGHGRGGRPGVVGAGRPREPPGCRGRQPVPGVAGISSTK